MTNDKGRKEASGCEAGESREVDAKDLVSN